jgi:hypothetical protein
LQVPSVQAVLVGFGKATFVNKSLKEIYDQHENNSDNDMKQYGRLLEQLLVYSPNDDTGNLQVRCFKKEEIYIDNYKISKI